MRTALVILAAMTLIPTYAYSEIGARVPPDGILVFEPRSQTLAPDDREMIAKLAVQAKANPANWVALEAYTNDLGGSEMNLALGQQRVHNVERELSLQGVPTHRIRGTSYKDERFDDKQLPMRRVEVRIQKLGL
jgi:peptidoglycan-associated lipoprotein